MYEKCHTLLNKVNGICIPSMLHTPTGQNTHPQVHILTHRTTYTPTGTHTHPQDHLLSVFAMPTEEENCHTLLNDVNSIRSFGLQCVFSQKINGELRGIVTPNFDLSTEILPLLPRFELFQSSLTGVRLNQ